MTTKSTTWLRGDRGSVPLALLVVIIMAGLTSVVMSRAVAEQRSTRFDNEYTTAMHAAEAGLEEAAFAINNHLTENGKAKGTGSINGYHYTWWAAQQESDESWLVGSSGTGPDGVTRTVGVDLADRPIFDLSLATHMGINFAGNNAADSYNSGSSPQHRCSGPGRDNSDPRRCFGIVASNGDIDMGSNTAYADRVLVYNWADNPGDHRCKQQTSDSRYCKSPYRENIDRPLDIHEHEPLVEEMLKACEGRFTSWKASDHMTGSRATFDPATLGSSVVAFSAHEEIEEVVCLSDLIFDKDTDLATSVTADDAAYVVVRDSMVVEKSKGTKIEVNCGACTDGFPPIGKMPAARRLQIFTLAKDLEAGSDKAAVKIRQQSKISAAIYAPNASCGGLAANAGVEIYGALICESVRNNGDWKFHYDAALRDGLTTGEYFVDRWREE